MEYLDAFWNLDVGQQARWDSIQRFFGPSNERVMFAACLVVAHSLTFYMINTFYYILDTKFRSSVEKFRFQPNKHPPHELVVKCIKHVSLFHLIVSFAPYIFFPLAMQHNPEMFSAPVPGLGQFIAQLVVSYLVTDFLFYWAHRTLHIPFLYQRIHKLHHQFHQPIGFACEYAHPIELVIGNMLPVAAGPLFFKFHFYVFVVWMVIAILGTSWGHSGFMQPLAYTKGHHDFHHSHNVGNYGSLPFWDFLMGTDRAYREYLERERDQQQQQQQKAPEPTVLKSDAPVTPRRGRSGSQSKSKKKRSTSVKRR